MTVSQGAPDLYKPGFKPMQDIFGEDKHLYEVLRTTVTDARLTKYMNTCKDDACKAIDLYFWNAKLGESLHVGLQTWEVTLRNKLNTFLLSKLGQNWPFEEKALRQLNERGRLKVAEAVERQKKARLGQTVTVGSIIADLSAGFWVSLLSKSYDVPFVWRKNIGTVFPHSDALSRAGVAVICNDLLDLRNRVAHHEPIFHLPLKQRRTDIDLLLKAMCPASFAFTNNGCPFPGIWDSRPQ